MTVLKLKKILDAAIAQGHGRRLVCVNTLRITHPLENDGVTIIPVTHAEMNEHEMADDDGSWKVLANGTVATRLAMVLSAEC